MVDLPSSYLDRFAVRGHQGLLTCFLYGIWSRHAVRVRRSELIASSSRNAAAVLPWSSGFLFGCSFRFFGSPCLVRILGFSIQFHKVLVISIWIPLHGQLILGRIVLCALHSCSMVFARCTCTYRTDLQSLLVVYLYNLYLHVLTNILLLFLCMRSASHSMVLCSYVVCRLVWQFSIYRSK